MSGAKGTRTPNPLLAKQVRYQLRHGPRSRCTISTDGTADSSLRNVTYQIARDILSTTIGPDQRTRGLAATLRISRVHSMGVVRAIRVWHAPRGAISRDMTRPRRS